MAKSERETGKVKAIRDENSAGSATATAVEEPPTPFDDTPPEEIAPEPEKPRRGRPPGNPTPKAVTFFERIAGILPEDWGARAKIRVYRLAPIIDRLRGSETKFVTMYEEVINEQRIKHDWGSGRYRLYLNFKMPTEKEKELDSVEIDILDMAYPPKVPPGEWVDDSRNKDWAWAKATFPLPTAPAAQASTATGVSDFVEVLRATNEVRKEMRQELQPPTPATPAAAAPAEAPKPVDPWDAAEKILNMRSENPMVTLMQEQLKLSNAAAEAAREREFKAQEAAREREFKLQQQLIEASKAQQVATAPKGLLEQLTELAAATEKLEPLKKLFGIATDGAAAPLRAGKLGWLDFAREVVPEVMNSRILNSLADRITQGTAPQFNPAIQTNGNGQAPPQQDILQFVQTTITPALVQHYEREQTGGDFAAWVFDGHPDRLAELQQFGEQKIFVLYQRHAPRSDWATLISRGEPAFAKFVHEFCTWKPEEDDEPAASPMATGGTVIDLDHDEKEETGS